MEVTTAHATDCAKKVNTAETLQAFLALLKLVNVSRLRKPKCNKAIMDELGGYEDRLLQFVDLLTATYNKKGAGWGFCTLVIKLMRPWTEEKAREKLDEEALVPEMYKNWCKTGLFSLVPEALLKELQPAFKDAFDYAARVLLGSSQPKAVASGMKLTKVLSAMCAIQTYLHTRTEPLERNLSGIEPVDDLERFDLQEDWEDFLNHNTAQGRGDRDRKDSEGPGAKRKHWWTNVDPDESDRSQFPCARCGRMLATASSLARHVSWACPASKPHQAAAKGVDANEEEPSGAEANDQAETETTGQAHRSSKRRKPATSDASDGGESFAEPAFYVATAFNTRVDKIVKKGARMFAEATSGQ
ncbi:hypothetical protein KFL_000900020 [Klebsormidium nitens]|uniref:C2H2-type domain-containing protein n=1 Tax=Klebsormidium nitens TaxID=105231 RepID=A0A0U9HS88_KLENI|nr:hypothetical protein KFL_000900020 [Klebsormidium nitens]|eukprot:GAQ81747.1 hypothetical protein KFL_000900020 [Klebsormidium nitens]